jgi:hypothetical protein
MSIVLANAKKAKLLEQERTYLNTLDIRLFKNNLTPTGANVLADFTEVTDAGYAPVNNVGFTAAILNGANQGQTTAPTVLFTFQHNAGDFTIFGYYFTDPADANKVVFSERASASFTVTANGDTYAVTPKKLMDTM